MSEWKKYKVGAKSTRSNYTEPDCQPLTTVSHVSHVDVAINIVQEGKIRQGLVFDESVLNTSRILVAWFSPNYWSNGFRYGGVKFEVDFLELIRGKKFYWVEAITKYTPTACRILITDQDRSSTLKAYDPTLREGPWWYDKSNDQHYVNGTYCLEFMLEQDVEIDDVSNISFVRHHPDYCSLHRTNPKACKELAFTAGRSGASFFTKAGSRSLDISNIANKLIDDEGKLRFDIMDAFAYVLHRLRTKATFVGAVDQTNDLALPLARAVMAAIAIGKEDEALEIAALFASEESLMSAISEIIEDSLDLPGSKEAIYKTFEV